MLVLCAEPPPTLLFTVHLRCHPGSPQLVSRDLLDAFEELVLRGHFRVDPRLPPAIWVLPGDLARIARSYRFGTLRQRCRSEAPALI